MSTTTLERTEVATAPAVELTPSEQDSLITLAVTSAKPARLRSTRLGPRAWSLGGNVD